MSKTSNVALCLHNHCKNLRMTLMQMRPPFIWGNEIVLNLKPISGSVGVGDVVADVGTILGVDPYPIVTTVTLTGDASSIEPEFMPEYDPVFEDERAEDSADDHPVPELSNRDKVLLQ
jgi:hypothetical protein